MKWLVCRTFTAHALVVTVALIEISIGRVGFSLMHLVNLLAGLLNFDRGLGSQLVETYIITQNH